MENLQRVNACGRLSITSADEITEASHIHTRGGLQARKQHKERRSHLELSLINTSGGLTGGDTLSWQIKADIDSQCTLSSPAAEKLYRSINGIAKMDINIDLRDRASLAWLPQETILFDQSRFERNSIFHIVNSSKLLIAETLVLGRQASGEILETFECTDRWKVYSEGRLIHREDVKLSEKEVLLLEGTAGLSRMKTITTLIYFGTDALNRLPSVQSNLRMLDENVIAACSAMTIGATCKLVCRLIAPEFYNVKPCLGDLIRRLNDQHLPKSWAL